MYLPVLKNARPVYRYRIGKYIAVIVTDCESIGMIQYTHVLFLLELGQPQPIFAVAAEMNSISSASGETKLFLGVFSGGGHENHGMSPDWADLDKFSARALQVVAERFKIEAPPELLSSSPPNPGLN